MPGRLAGFSLIRETARRVLATSGMKQMEPDRPERHPEPEPRAEDSVTPLEPEDPPTQPNDPTGKELTTPEDTLGG
jgi:hypothetical protein